MKSKRLAALPMGRYAARQAGRLFNRLEARLAKADKRRDPVSIHDLRVAIRRLAACLHAMASLLPASDAKRVRRRLKELIDAASEVRNRDVALDLWGQAGLPEDSAVRSRLAAERHQAELRLFALVERYRRRKSLDRWRNRLEV